MGIGLSRLTAVLIAVILLEAGILLYYKNSYNSLEISSALLEAQFNIYEANRIEAEKIALLEETRIKNEVEQLRDNLSKLKKPTCDQKIEQLESIISLWGRG